MGDADDTYGLRRGNSLRNKPILRLTSTEFPENSPHAKKSRKKSSTREPPRPKTLQDAPGGGTDEEGDQRMEEEGARLDSGEEEGPSNRGTGISWQERKEREQWVWSKISKQLAENRRRVS